MAELLGLILHDEKLARRAANNPELSELLMDTQIGRAIREVLAAVDNDEWADAENRLRDGDMIHDSAVGKVLADERFRELQSIGEQAFQDCERNLHEEAVERQMKMKQQAYNDPNISKEQKIQIWSEMVKLRQQNPNRFRFGGRK